MAFVVCQISGPSKDKQLEGGNFEIVIAINLLPSDCVEREIRRSLPKINDVRSRNSKEVFDGNRETNDLSHIELCTLRRKDTEVKI